MTTPPLADVPVTTQRGLRERWADVLAPPVFSARSLWIMWLRPDGTALPTLVPIDELPHRFDPGSARSLVELAATISEEHSGGDGHVAFALCRPGHPASTPGDQEWAAGLHRAAARADLRSWSLHLAAGGAVVTLVEPPWPRESHPG
jgi:hypothetical protein